MEQPIPEPASPEQPKPKKRRTNVPAVIVSGVICLGLGAAGGVVLGQLVEFKEKPAAAASGEGGGDEGKGGDGKAKGDGGGKGGGGGGKGGAGGGKGGQGKAQGKAQPGGGGAGGGGGGPGGGGNVAKIQLTQLVGMLDDLTAKSTIQLDAEQKKQAGEILAGLEGKDELTTQDAQTKLSALLKVVEGQKDAILAAGFLWPGQQPAPSATANPLKDNGHLKSLQATLGK